MTTHNRRLGTYGENCATAHLLRLGMEVLDRNWRCDLGELDLVLREGGTAVFCEVKTRTSTAFGDPLEAVTPVKAQRLRHLADRWLEVHHVRPRDVRIDLVGVLLGPAGRTTIEHVRGAC
ncbi:YraN family protein [Nocardioides mangrovicus]|uniref:UPF0102 protein D9V37_09515 n=1 Tax=Nocardioides mangrovicus TaxID=2478913 RepID=A0A3L8P1J9_9ACTN|nr:YraN family protein [Nocardioides mangrovicus]RLV48837.1 YraN family protein [Nocardioides mangrovicus]